MIGFVHIPKTAGSTVKFILRNSFCLRHCDVRSQNSDRVFTAPELQLVRLVYPNLVSISGHSLVNPATHLSGIRLFTVLRDPVERVASAYQHHARGRRRKRLGFAQMTLEEYVHHRKVFNRQTRQIAGTVDLERAKTELRSNYFAVLLLERFQESVSVMARLSPYPIDTHYTRKNTAPDNAFKKQILADAACRRLIEDANAVDRELYDWVVRELYPEQLARARQAGELPAVGGEGGALRARLSRTYNNVFYRSLLIKIRGLFKGQPAAPDEAVV